MKGFPRSINMIASKAASQKCYKCENRIPVYETNGPEGFGYFWRLRIIKQPNTYMETKHKEQYVSPTADAVEVRNEGVICQSPRPDFTGFGDEETL